jgi:hypothetical protein
MSRIDFNGCVWIVPVILMFFVSFSVTGCASGKGGNEIAGVIENPADSSVSAESTRKDTSQAQTTVEENTDEDLIQENQDTPATNRIRPIKRPAELKPLLAVMPG